MKKWLVWGLIILVLVTVVWAYFIYNSKYRCSSDNSANCNLNCNSNSDCKQSYCSCINQNEKMFVPSGISHMTCVQTNCRCINNQCNNIKVEDICELDEFQNKDECCKNFPDKYLKCGNGKSNVYWNSQNKSCECKS